MALDTKILLVESDSAWAHLIVQTLKGYKVEIAPSAEVALDEIVGREFDAIVINLNLPEHNGIEFLNERVSDQDMLKIPVIVYSSWPELNQISGEAWSVYKVHSYLKQTDLVKELPGKLAEVL